MLAEISTARRRVPGFSLTHDAEQDQNRGAASGSPAIEVLRRLGEKLWRLMIKRLLTISAGQQLHGFGVWRSEVTLPIYFPLSGDAATRLTILANGGASRPDCKMMRDIDL